MATSPTASQGSQGQMAIKQMSGGAGADPTFASGSYVCEFSSETLTKTESKVDSNGIRGTRVHMEEQTRDGTFTVQGTISTVVTPLMLDTILPFILGAASSGTPSDTFDPAETLPVGTADFGVLLDKVGASYAYYDCFVNRATFRGSPGNLVTLDLDIVGKTQTVDAYDGGSFSTADTNDPYVFHEVSFNADGETSVEIEEFTLVVDNQLDVKFRNSQSATSITARDRIVSLDVVLPYNSTNSTAFYGGTDASGSMAWTHSHGTGWSTTWTFTYLQTINRAPPSIPGKDEIPFRVSYLAKDTSDSGKEVSVVNDTTA